MRYHIYAEIISTDCYMNSKNGAYISDDNIEMKSSKYNHLSPQSFTVTIQYSNITPPSRNS